MKKYFDRCYDVSFYHLRNIGKFLRDFQHHCKSSFELLKRSAPTKSLIVFYEPLKSREKTLSVPIKIIIVVKLLTEQLWKSKGKNRQPHIWAAFSFFRLPFDVEPPQHYINLRFLISLVYEFLPRWASFCYSDSKAIFKLSHYGGRDETLYYNFISFFSSLPATRKKLPKWEAANAMGNWWSET